MMYEAKVKLKADIKPNIWTKGDPERLTRLVSIFLDNASKYTPEGGEVSVLLTTSGRLATLSVTNTSTPLSKDQLDHVFDRFYKVDPARSDETSYGLGLAIAQEIALSMGGKIEVIAINELPGNAFVTTLPCV
jgi:signal transduction histidine kinase